MVPAIVCSVSALQRRYGWFATKHEPNIEPSGRVCIIICHNGPGIGGGEFKKFGVIEDYWKATGSKELDEGRFLATKDPDDKYVFKVPSLRNVAVTAPYFHDGSVGSLAEAVRAMARLQLGVTAGDKEVRDIVLFLGSLTGTLPGGFATTPVLPAEH